jgi:hypothetical protein
MIATASPFTGFQPIAKLGALSTDAQKHGRQKTTQNIKQNALLAGTCLVC